MRTGEVLATEALVRWQHPTWGLLLPIPFIGVAESINLAGELGRWVMRRACAEFSRGGPAVSAARHAATQRVPGPAGVRGFAEAVAETLADFDLPGESVCLEITESVVVQDIETTRITLAALKEVGVQIAIDDFGTGYSDVTHLKSLPVDTLKIDRSFVRDLGERGRPGDRARRHRPGRRVRPRGGRRGSGDQCRGRDPAAARLLPGAGLLLSRPLSSAAMSKLFARKYIELPFATSRRAVP